MTAYLMLLPTLVLIGAFTVYPIFKSFIISFYDWDMLNPVRTFVGFSNYVHIFEDPLFRTALFNTLLYVVLFVPIVLVVGLGAALLLNAKIRFRPFFRTAMFLPYVTSLSATGIIWSWIFNNQFGILNYLLHFFGIQPQDWLNNTHLTMFNLVLLSVWQNVGYVAVVFLAGLQGISRQYYEAAQVDGASGWHRLRNITIPLLSPTTYFLLLLTTIEGFKVFLQVYVLYGETPGPNNTGLTLLYYMFNEGFNDYRMGYASAAAYVLFLITFIFTLVQMLLSRRVHYDG